jgi:signal transduction histidine kinase
MKGSIMKQILLMVFSLLMFAPSVTRAEEYATLDDARNLAERAATLVREVGKDAALPKFNDQKGDYIYRDLYVFVIGYDGMMYAHGRPAVVGKNMLELKDASGKFFVKDMAIFAKEGGKAGWVDYMFLNPATGKIEPKSSYVIPFDGFYVGVGAYKINK